MSKTPNKQTKEQTFSNAYFYDASPGASRVQGSPANRPLMQKPSNGPGYARPQNINEYFRPLQGYPQQGQYATSGHGIGHTAEEAYPQPVVHYGHGGVNNQHGQHVQAHANGYHPAYTSPQRVLQAPQAPMAPIAPMAPMAHMMSGQQNHQGYKIHQVGLNHAAQSFSSQTAAQSVGMAMESPYRPSGNSPPKKMGYPAQYQPQQVQAQQHVQHVQQPQYQQQQQPQQQAQNPQSTTSSAFSSPSSNHSRKISINDLLNGSSSNANNSNASRAPTAAPSPAPRPAPAMALVADKLQRADSPSLGVKRTISDAMEGLVKREDGFGEDSPTPSKRSRSESPPAVVSAAVKEELAMKAREIATGEKLQVDTNVGKPLPKAVQRVSQGTNTTSSVDSDLSTSTTTTTTTSTATSTDTDSTPPQTAIPSTPKVRSPRVRRLKLTYKKCPAEYLALRAARALQPDSTVPEDYFGPYSRPLSIAESASGTSTPSTSTGYTSDGTGTQSPDYYSSGYASLDDGQTYRLDTLSSPGAQRAKEAAPKGVPKRGKARSKKKRVTKKKASTEEVAKKPKKKFQPQTVPVGIDNESKHCCFLNTIIQVLYYMPEVREFARKYNALPKPTNFRKLTGTTRSSARNVAKDDDSKSDEEYPLIPLTDAFVNFIRDLMASDFAVQSIRPDMFVAMASGHLGGLLDFRKDQDVEEFMMLLSQKCEEECEGKGGSVFEEVFGGEVREEFRCEACMATWANTTPMRSLHLQLTPDFSLRSSLNAFGATETYTKHPTSDPRSPCKCPLPTLATKSTRISRAPKYLRISFKRFSVGTNGTSAKKVSENVNFPATLRLEELNPEPILPPPAEASGFELPASPPTTPPVVASPAPTEPDQSYPRYELMSVIRHTGRQLNGGHYTAYCRDGERWWHLDDCNVRESCWGEVLGAEAYVLVYGMREGDGGEAEKEKERAGEEKVMDAKAEEENPFLDTPGTSTPLNTDLAPATEQHTNTSLPPAPTNPNSVQHTTTTPAQPFPPPRPLHHPHLNPLLPRPFPHANQPPQTHESDRNKSALTAPSKVTKRAASPRRRTPSPRGRKVMEGKVDAEGVSDMEDVDPDGGGGEGRGVDGEGDSEMEDCIVVKTRRG